MAEDIGTIGGYRREVIDQKIESVASRVSSLEKMVVANGRPSLEDRVRQYAEQLNDETRVYVDQRDEHRTKGLQDFIANKDHIAKQDAKIMQLTLEAKVAEAERLTRENGFRLEEMRRAAEVQATQRDKSDTAFQNDIREMKADIKAQSKLIYIAIGMGTLLNIALPFIIPLVFHTSK